MKKTPVRRRAVCLVAAVALTYPCVAQDPEQAAGPKTFEELSAEFDGVWRAWRDETPPRESPTDELAAHAAADPTAQYVGEFVAGAEEHKGTERAIDYLMWVVGRGWPHDRSAPLVALDQLVDDHKDHPRMTRAAFSLALRACRSGFPRDRVLDAQDVFAAHAASDEARAEVLFWRCYVIKGTESSPADWERAKADLATVKEIGAPAMGARADGMLFEVTRLQVGMPAPDIEGEDLDGAAFRLSDYGGRVVLLDFWGDW